MNTLSMNELLAINGGGNDYLGYALSAVAVIALAYVCPPVAIAVGLIIIGSDLIDQH